MRFIVLCWRPCTALFRSVTDDPVPILLWIEELFFNNIPWRCRTPCCWDHPNHRGYPHLLINSFLEAHKYSSFSEPSLYKFRVTVSRSWKTFQKIHFTWWLKWADNQQGNTASSVCSQCGWVSAIARPIYPQLPSNTCGFCIPGSVVCDHDDANEIHCAWWPFTYSYYECL